MSDDQSLRELLTDDRPARPAFRAALRDQLTDEWHGGAAGPTPVAPRRRAWWGIAAAAAVVGLVVVGLAWVTRSGGPAAPPSATSPEVQPTSPAPTVSESTAPVPTTVAAPAVNGWMAVQGEDGGLELVRSDFDAPRIEVPGPHEEEPCPAFSPDGTKLAFGRVTTSTPGMLGPDTTFSDAELVVVPISKDGVVGIPSAIALDGFDTFVCGIWAPDGRWVAVPGARDVWLVDTETTAIRRLPGLQPMDVEWRPGTDELTMAGVREDVATGAAAQASAVTVYSASTGEQQQLGSVSAAYITWSPDGSTLAYVGIPPDYDLGDPGDVVQLRLVDADGTNDRRLVADIGAANHGIGPMWSPAGDRIVYQRLNCSSICGERHEIVLVDTVTGAETVVEELVIEGPDREMNWFPRYVVWSPDGSTLLSSAWPNRGTSGMLVLPADLPADVAQLGDARSPVGFEGRHVWAPTQMWGVQPA